MLYVKNVPNWERALRIVVGLAVAVLAILRVGGSTGWLVAAAAAGIVLSGLVGFCPACAMIGRRIDK